MTEPAPLLAVDGMSMLYTTLGRAGEPTAHAFLGLLRRAVHHLPAAPEIVVAFDGPGARAERQKLYPAYKTNRTRRPEDDALIAQLPEVRALLERCGIPAAEVPGAEGDDVIASIVTAEEPGRRIAIWSRDRDLYGLITDRVFVLDSTRPEGRFVLARHVLDRFGVHPRQWADYRALIGDQSDGITGVPGIGPTTAAQLLAGGTFRLEDIPGSGRCISVPRARPLIEQMPTAYLCRSVIALRRDIPTGYVSTGRPSPPLPQVHELARV